VVGYQSVEAPAFIIISAAVNEKVFGSHVALLAPVDENNDRLRLRILSYG
jgi:hypothetical protein